MSHLPTICPSQAQEKIQQGACLIDIRSLDEHRRHYIENSCCIPVSNMAKSDPLSDKSILIFHCLGGLRTQSNMATLHAFANGREAYILENGLDGWQKEGLPTIKDTKQPIEIQRQVHIIAGTLILIGIILGTIVHSAFYALSAFVGAGLLVAGISGFCGMAKVLALLPYNRS